MSVPRVALTPHGIALDGHRVGLGVEWKCRLEGLSGRDFTFDPDKHVARFQEEEGKE